MQLIKSMESSGEVLFRHRGVLPLLFAVPTIMVAMNYKWPFGSHAIQEAWEIVCLTLTATGLVIRILVAGHVPAGTSGRNARSQRATCLNSTGMYSLCRHPLYLGNFFVGMGWVCFFLNGWLVTSYVLAFWLYYERIMLAEEAFLRTQFPEEFPRFANDTPAFIPRWRGWISPELPFSWPTAIRREYLTGTLAIVVFYFLELTEHLVVESRFVVEPFWSVLLATGMLMFVVVRAFRKWTRCFEISGR